MGHGPHAPRPVRLPDGQPVSGRAEDQVVDADLAEAGQGGPLGPRRSVPQRDHRRSGARARIVRYRQGAPDRIGCHLDDVARVPRGHRAQHLTGGRVHYDERSGLGSDNQR